MEKRDSRSVNPADELRGTRIISGGLLAGSVFFLALALALRETGIMDPSQSGLELLAYVAVGWAVVSVPIADVMRKARWPTVTPQQDPFEYWSKSRSAQIVSMAIAESAVFFCAIALMVSPPWWPAAAALVPLGAMIAWFPRE